MPSTSKSQQNLFRMVAAYKDGHLPDASAKVKSIAKGVSKGQAAAFTKRESDYGDTTAALLARGAAADMSGVPSHADEVYPDESETPGIQSFTRWFSSQP